MGDAATEQHYTGEPYSADSALVDVVGVRRKIELGLLQDDTPWPGDWGC